MKKNLLFTKLLLIITVLSASAQITNSGFENWTTTGNYEEPGGWATMNPYSAGSFYSCTKSTDHYPANVGSYSIRLENNTSLTQFTGGWGMAITDTMAYPFQPSFPVSGHPTSLTGYYKFNSLNSDSVWIKVVLFDNGAIVMDEQINEIGSQTWTSFSIPFDTYVNADSATILLCAFFPIGQFDGPNGNSVLYVDNLNFDALISDVAEPASTTASFSLYPNPASDFVTLTIDNKNNSALTLDIYSITGELVRTEMPKQNQQQVNVSDLSNGIFLIELKSAEFTEAQKLIIQH